MLKTTTTALAALTLSTVALAQEPCSTLAVDVTAGDDGTTLSVDVTGATPLALTFLLIGDTAGETVLDLGPLGTATLGLEQPFAVAPLGMTDIGGNLSISQDGPSIPGELLPLNLFTQAVNAGLEINPGGPPSLVVCTSNVVGVTID